MQNSMIPLIYTDKLILNNFKLALNQGCKDVSSTRKNKYPWTMNYELKFLVKPVKFFSNDLN